MRFRVVHDPAVPIEGQPHHFRLQSTVVEAETAEEAEAKVKALLQPDQKLWYTIDLDAPHYEEE